MLVTPEDPYPTLSTLAATGDFLRASVFRPRLERGGSLLIPSWASREERVLQDIHKLLDDRVAKRAGLSAGSVRSKAFLHTYCAARLQTLDARRPSVALHGRA